MALKITEVDGKLVLEGNINSVTSMFLTKHIQMIKSLNNDNGQTHSLDMNFLTNQ